MQEGRWGGGVPSGRFTVMVAAMGSSGFGQQASRQVNLPVLLMVAMNCGASKHQAAEEAEDPIYQEGRCRDPNFNVWHDGHLHLVKPLVALTSDALRNDENISELTDVVRAAVQDADLDLVVSELSYSWTPHHASWAVEAELLAGVGPASIEAEARTRMVPSGDHAQDP
ncbi:hypothetical protein BDM02DRAFT_3261194 [Thelephora ganbajun]|uniref:Uncharacterized protein n=1 Tax=Thelephora ganbajun TaxID=370292 RepID=A0ACB6ZF92_THEGA|nr:hypothetical protein BDM02DRAFT_3261194 [Thelephora ganbajun]